MDGVMRAIRRHHGLVANTTRAFDRIRVYPRPSDLDDFICTIRIY